MKVKFCILMGIAALLMTGCGKQEKAKSVPRLVLLQTVAGGDALETITYPGRTRASDEADVSFRISGTLQSVSVHEGDYVRKGQVLARMDDRDYRVQLSAAEAEYKQVKAEAERVISLYAENVGTANNYDKARYGLQQITQKLQHCRDQVNDCVLRAPFDGYVQTVQHESYETVGSGMPVVSLISKGPAEVFINIPASENLRRSQFASFTARFDVLPGKQFPLKLLSISRQANVNQLYEVRLALQDYNAEITPGMSTMVQLTLRTDGVRPVVIPLSAINRKGGECFVFVYDKGHVRQTSVTLGRVHDDGNVDVVSGLNAGTQIVVSGVSTLSDGEAVRPTPKPSKTNVGELL